MEKSVKIALIGFLIVLAYSTSVLVETGYFIIPFPLFSFVLLGVLGASIVQERSHWKTFIPISVVVLFRCLCNPLTYTFFLNEAAYDSFTEGITLDLFRISAMLSVLPLIIQVVGFKGNQDKITALALCSVYILTLIPPFELLNYTFFTIFFLCLILTGRKHLTTPLLVLIALFDLLEGYCLLFS